MLQEEILSQKGLLGREKCEKDGAVGRDACSMVQPLLSAGSVDWSFPFFLHSLLSKGLYSLYKEKPSPGKDVYSIVLKFGGEEGKGRKRLDWGVWGGRQWEKAKAGMHERPEQQPRRGKRTAGDRQTKCAWSLYRKSAKTWTGAAVKHPSANGLWDSPGRKGCQQNRPPWRPRETSSEKAVRRCPEKGQQVNI